MPNFIKHMYREFLQGHTDIIKVDEDLTLAPRGSGKLFIQKDRYSNKWNAQNTCIGHQGRWTFCHEALAAAYLQGADIAQLVMLDDLLDRAKQKGLYNGWKIPDALLSYAPAGRSESLAADPMMHFIELSKSFSENGGIYDPVHGIYIDSEIGEGEDATHVTLYNLSVEEIEKCIAAGIEHINEMPSYLDAFYGLSDFTTICDVTLDDYMIDSLIVALCDDGRWCEMSELNEETLARFKDVIAKANRIDAETVKDDEWRDGMVQQVSGSMGAIKDMDAQEAKGADTILAEMFDSLAENSTDAVMNMLEVYSRSDTSGRAAVAEVFQVLTGETFDSFLMQASDACEQTLGRFDGESLDEMMEQKVELAGDGELGEELSVSNGER